jgi:hypothetical protein
MAYGAATEKCTKCQRTASDEDDVALYPCGLCTECDGEFSHHYFGLSSVTATSCAACVAAALGGLPKCPGCGLPADVTALCGTCVGCVTAAAGGAAAHNAACAVCGPAAEGDDEGSYCPTKACATCSVVTSLRHCESCPSPFSCPTCWARMTPKMTKREMAEYQRADAGYMGDA